MLNTGLRVSHVWFACVLSLAVAHSAAAEFPEMVRAVPVVRGLSPLTQVTSAGDGSGRLFTVERAGRISILLNGALLPDAFLDIRDRVLSENERGLLGLAFPPGYREKGYFYVFFSERLTGDTLIARYSVGADPNRGDPASEKVILRLPQQHPTHKGGMLAFNPLNGMLYAGLGDGGVAYEDPNPAQDPQSLMGKIIRIDTESGPEPGEPEVWASGLRNPWRFSFDRANGDLWIADVGGGLREEVNYQPAGTEKGVNYGWRIMEGTSCLDGETCASEGLTTPIFEYTHDFGCSITGGYVYRGSRYPTLRGVYVAGDFCLGTLFFVAPSATTPGAWESRRQRLHGLLITSFGEDEDGELYVATIAGNVYRLEAGVPSVTADGVVNAASYARGLTPGSLGTVFGQFITSVDGVLGATSIPLPNDLGDVSVSINGLAAPILAVADVNGQQQINFEVPWELETAASAQVIVTVNGVSAGPVEVEVAAAEPGIFAVVHDGNAGQVYATGLGGVQSRPSTGSAGLAANTVLPVNVLVGGHAARVTYSGLSPEFVGVYQINFEVPAAAVTGSEVVVTVAGKTSNAARL